MPSPEPVSNSAAGTASARARSVTSTSRSIHTTSIPDEGRFIPGTLIAGRYRVIGLLGRGGMGEVYRATDLTLAQSVALKFLPENAASNERLLERFHNEVRVARQVSHPNVCRVYDIGEADGVPFISMEYVDGEDLASLLQRIGRLPSDKALEIARKVCAGVGAAHERGIIHRDLKPHNIMLNRRGEVVVMDFGLAAVADELRGAEVRDGTPAYMAPEQLRGDSATAKSDIYALGLIIYELFTGKRAFEANSMQELMRMQENSRPLSVTTVAADADPAVEKVILRCLHTDPAQRPPTALSVAAALPGGDPLAAALAAGETPSPELVAASGKTEGFPLKYAVPLLIFNLLGVLAVPFIAQINQMLTVAPLPHPMPVLEQKAREHAESFGYTAPPADRIAWWEFDGSMTSHFRKAPGPKDWKTILNARNPYQAVYRQSPRYLLSDPDGSITLDRPPMTIPDMVAVVVDSRGRLARFEAVPPREDPAPPAPVPAPAAFDPAPVFRAAGLDINTFQEITPKYVPRQPFDFRKEWTGPYPGLHDTKVNVTVAAYAGKLVTFYMRWPWTQLPAATQKPMTRSERISTLFELLFVGVGLFCVIFFARRNMKRSRGDRSGATRLALAAFLAFVTSWIFRHHMVPRSEVMGYAFVDFSLAFAICALIWLAYMALEPMVRARWPHSLITWNRVLAGNIRDARVGSHILIGVAVGVTLFLVFMLRSHWEQQSGGPPDGPDVGMLMGASRVAGNLLSVVFGGIQTSIIIFFVLCGLRALVRSDWAASLLSAALFSFQDGVLQSDHIWIDFPLYILVFGSFAMVLLRMGLVPSIIGILVINSLSRTPIGSSFLAWYNGTGAFVLVLVAAMAIYGFWSSRQPPTQTKAT